MLSATAVADLNNDGLMDLVAITTPTTITVSLAKPDGSYVVSDVLTVSKSQPIQDVYLQNLDSDDDLEIVAVGSKRSGSSYSLYYRNNGDGTFDYIEPVNWKKFSRWFI